MAHSQDAVDTHSKKAQSSTIEECLNSFGKNRRSFAAAWSLFGVNHGLSGHAFSSPLFTEAIKVTVAAGVHKMSEPHWHEGLTDMKKSLTLSMRDSLRSKPACLILDGWRVSYKNGEHAHAFLLSNPEGKVYFHKLIGDILSHDVPYLARMIDSVINEAKELYGCIVTSIVVDNAKVMLSAMSEVQRKRSYIIGHPCCAHWLQLILKDMSNRQLVKRAWDTVSRIVRCFTGSKKAMRRLRSSIGVCRMKTCSLAPPCVTRWSSMVDCALAVLRLQPAIQLAAREGGGDVDLMADDSDFMLIAAVVQPLIPLCNATDAVQSDSAGLLLQELILNDTQEQLEKLKDECTSTLHRDFVADVLKAFTGRRVGHDSGHLKAATSGALLLSLKPSALSAAHAEEGKAFLIEKGPAILQALKPNLYGSMTEECLQDDIKQALCVHIGKDEGCDSLEAINIDRLVEYWNLCLIGSRAHLASIAMALFAVRSSEAAAERVFSHASLLLSPQRNRLSTEYLDLELFVKVNFRACGIGGSPSTAVRYRRPRRKRFLSESQSGAALQSGSSNADKIVVEESPMATASSAQEEELPTACLPLGYVDLDSEEVVIDLPNYSSLLCCSGCSELFSQISSSEAEDWWRCKRCFSPYCRDCADAFLDDDSGLCAECSDCTRKFLKELSSRRRS